MAVNPSSLAAEVEFPYSSPAPAETIYGVDQALTPLQNAFKIRLPGISGGIYRLRKS